MFQVLVQLFQVLVSSSGESITLTAAGAIEIGTATANDGGAFSVTISVLGLPSGAHSLEANDAMGVIVIGGALLTGAP